jgi:hypothetical protein
MTVHSLPSDEEVRAIASMASLALALLAFFTNVRFNALKEERAGVVDSFNRKTAGNIALDLGLALFTGAAVLVMASLCFETFQFSELGHRVGAVSSMFALIWLGFVAVLLFQLGMALTRVCDAVSAGHA